MVELHCHSEESAFDSAVSPSALVARAKELGVTKMALTEHGVLTSADKFADACHKAGIEPVLGVEAYVKLDEKTPFRSHLCLYAKDAVGKRAIGKAVTESFNHLDRDKPIMDKECLETYFGESSEGHGHVIAASACISGVVASVFLQNDEIDKKTRKLREKAGDVLNLICLPTEQEEKIKELSQKIDALTPIASRKFKARENALKKQTGRDYIEMKEAYDRDFKETQEALSKLNELKKQKKTEKRRLTLLMEEYREFLKKKGKQDKIFAQIAEWEGKKILEEDIYETAKQTALIYKDLFGDFFLELQYHGLDDEKKVMPKLAQIAEELSLPIVATNDAHMAKGDEKSIRARTLMRSLKYLQLVEENVADKELYIKSDEELSNALKKILPENTVKQAIQGRYDLLEQCHEEKDETPHYPKFTENGNKLLRQKVKEGIKIRFPQGLPKEYSERIDKELSVICDMGFADYHLIVQDYMEYARLLGGVDITSKEFEAHRFDKEWLKNNQTRTGMSTGPGRGSAVGSLVCFLLGITDIDPIQYNLVFERFLNPERVSMPDIDCDIAPSVRDLVKAYVCHLYGAECVCSIMTKNRMQARASVDFAAKIAGLKQYDDTLAFTKEAKELKKLITDDKLPERENVPEKLLFIYDDAVLINGVYKSDGSHAAGVVISDGVPVVNYVPLMPDNKAQGFKTQCTMTEVEEDHHLLKMDFLGLSNLDMITDTMRLLEKRGVVIKDFPIEDVVFEEIFAKGFSNGVFQVESDGMKNMLKKARPKSMEDIIILVSMYRPGPIDSLTKLLPVMAGEKEPEYLIPELKPILEPTYGCIVYQEQVMQIVRDLAGYSYGRSDLVRRAMSKKKKDVMEKEKRTFIYGNDDIKGCIKNGISEDKALQIWDEMAEFAKYAFNKSHATAYSMISYYTAYLKYHYPKEYLSVALTYAPSKKIRQGYAEDLKSLFIPFLNPDINKAQVDFSIKDNGIMYGLSQIKDIATKAEFIINERKNGLYTGVADFVIRTQINGTALKNLILAGCFDFELKSFKTRTTCLKQVDETLIVPPTLRKRDVIKEIKAKQKVLADPLSSATKKTNAKKSLGQIKEELLALTEISQTNESFCADASAALFAEEEVLGLMLSGHPADFYEKGDAYFTDGDFCKAIGYITNLRTLQTKNGNPFFRFTLSLPDREMGVSYFNSDFKFSEKSVVKVFGKYSEAYGIAAKEIFVPEKRQKTLYFLGDENWDREDWDALLEELESFQAKDGVFFVTRSDEGKFARSNYRIRLEAMKEFNGLLL